MLAQACSQCWGGRTHQKDHEPEAIPGYIEREAFFKNQERERDGWGEGVNGRDGWMDGWMDGWIGR